MRQRECVCVCSDFVCVWVCLWVCVLGVGAVCVGMGYLYCNHMSSSSSLRRTHTTSTIARSEKVFKWKSRRFEKASFQGQEHHI
jgi:hypothetical protein